jgi:2,5-dioxopentanoate dehydrogenase
MEPILVNGSWEASDDTGEVIRSDNPHSGEWLPYEYPVSSWDELQLMLDAATVAVDELRLLPSAKLADFLSAYADEIEAAEAALVEVAGQETGLPTSTRLPGELKRTTGQLRQAAAAARDRSWAMATIDTASNIRSMYEPLGGPVVVFGPNNFPLAFNGVSGGDFAAAIAAGNPVIAKANPGHPRTTQLLAAAALRAIEKTGVPRGLVQMFYHTPHENGLRLVSHPSIGATAFTGSKAGLHLKRAADEAGKPIYLEMSSVNPVFILPGALVERLEDVATDLFASCTLGTGQFCTNPGLVFLMAGENTDAFIASVSEKFKAKEPDVMLTSRGPDQLERGLGAWQKAGANLIVGGEPVRDDRFRFHNTLMKATGEQFLANPEAMQTEAFGVASLLVIVENVAQFAEVTQALAGNLTGTIYSHTDGSDDKTYDLIAPLLRDKVGRLLNDKMPTGVAVVPSMMHGGPFPSTGHPGFTAVGIPASLVRFAKLTSYDNVRPSRLPAALKDTAPHDDMWRLVDGAWQQGDIQ